MVTANPGDVFRDIAEIVELELNEALQARTHALASFRDLGPPDLVHVVKKNMLADANAPYGQGTLASFHHVQGSNTSSPADIAAYLMDLQRSLDEIPAQTEMTEGVAIGGMPKSNWKIIKATFCTFNAFARLDMRVEVKIPGGVSAWAVDVRGDKVTIPTDEGVKDLTALASFHDKVGIWEEVWVCGVLRSLLDDTIEAEGSHPLPACRRLIPIPDLNSETRFLTLAGRCFPRGHQLGTIPEIQSPTNVCNYLMLGLFSWFSSGEKVGLWNLDPELKKPRLTRGKIAIEFAKKLVQEFPESLDASSFLGWLYWCNNEEVEAWKEFHQISQKTPHFASLLAQYHMLSYKKDALALDIAEQLIKIAPSEPMAWWHLTHAWIQQGNYEKALITLNTSPMLSWQENDRYVVKYPAPARISLPLKPSTLLDPIHAGTKLEFPSIAIRNVAGNFTGTWSWSWGMDMAGTHLATPSIKSNVTGSQLQAELLLQQHAQANQIHGDLLRLPSLTLKGTFLAAYKLLPYMVEKVGWDQVLQERGKAFVMEQEYRAGLALNDGQDGKLLDKPQKRMCERWLDNLFMLLYEDLRLYAALKTESQHCHQQRLNSLQISSRKTPAEWEIYGDLCQRLGHVRDAKECWKYAMEQRWRSKSMLHDLSTDLKDAVDTLSKLASAWERSYSPPMIPNPISRQLIHLIQDHGYDKVENACRTVKNVGLLQKWLSLIQTFQ